MDNLPVKMDDINDENMPAVYVKDGLSQFLEATKEEVSEVSDLSTAKGRKRVSSMSAKVSSNKVIVVKKGREYLARLKAQPKIIEKELRTFIESMDSLRDETRQPLSDWEAKQEEIELAKQREIAAKELREKIENDHEIGLLLDDQINRDKADAERAQRDELEMQKVDDEIEAYVHEDNLLMLAEVRDERIRQEAIEKAEKEKQDETDRADREAKAAAEAKELLMLNEAHSENDRIKREWLAYLNDAHTINNKINYDRQAKIDADNAAETARLAEVARQKAVADRLAEDQRKREANTKHKGAINRQICKDLMAIPDVDITLDQAKKIVVALATKAISDTVINY